MKDLISVRRKFRYVIRRWELAARILCSQLAAYAIKHVRIW